MRRTIFAVSLYAFSACKVAPCPPEIKNCGVALATGGSGGNTATIGSSGGTSGADDAGESGGSGDVPSGKWTNATSNLGNVSSECGTLSIVSAKPDEDVLITGISLNGLWSSTNGGSTWKALGTGAKSDKVTNRPWSIIYDPDHSDVFWEAGGYNGAGVFQTTDDGVTLKKLGDIGSIDEVRIDFTDPDRKTLLAGKHEVHNVLYRSEDGGATWTDIGKNLPDGTCSFPAVIDSKTHLVGCSGYAGGAGGIFRTTDGGRTWDSVTDLGGGGRTHLEASDGSIYWLNAANTGLARSTDEGQTWTQVNDAVASPPIELPDGRLAAVVSNQVAVSTNHGKSWRAVTTSPPTQVNGLTYSRQQKAFFAWHEICGNNAVPVPTDAVLRYDLDVESD